MLPNEILANFIQKIHSVTISKREAKKNIDEIQKDIRALQKQLDKKYQQISKLSEKLHRETYSYNEDLILPIAMELSQLINRDFRIFSHFYRYQLCFINPNQSSDILALTLNTKEFESKRKLRYDTQAIASSWADLLNLSLNDLLKLDRSCREFPAEWEEIIKLLQPVPLDYRFLSLHELGEAVAKLKNWTVCEERPEDNLITFRMPWRDTHRFLSENDAKQRSLGLDDQGQVLCHLTSDELAEELRIATQEIK